MRREVHRQNIEEVQRLRGWISNSYAQIEFMLGDLILRCRAYSEYPECQANLTHSAAKRVRIVRSMLQRSGPLDPFGMELTSILDRFEDRQGTRNLLAHGFFEYHAFPDGDAVLRFQKWHRQDRDDVPVVRTFLVTDLEAEKAEFVALANEAVHLFRRLHGYFGWIGS